MQRAEPSGLHRGVSRQAETGERERGQNGPQGPMFARAKRERRGQDGAKRETRLPEAAERGVKKDALEHFGVQAPDQSSAIAANSSASQRIALSRTTRPATRTMGRKSKESARRRASGASSQRYALVPNAIIAARKCAKRQSASAASTGSRPRQVDAAPASENAVTSSFRPCHPSWACLRPTRQLLARRTRPGSRPRVRTSASPSRPTPSPAAASDR